MSIGEVISEARTSRGMTQSELAGRIFVTRQAVSRWETGVTTPGVDMCKLLAVTLDVPVTRLLEMPPEPFCQSCAMPLTTEKEHGSEADGVRSEDYCAWCYQDGEFTAPELMKELIEYSAPFMSKGVHITEDEAISYMAAVLPGLKRWKDQKDQED